MSSFESFYGGRQGASFVIVKRFDAISVADDTEFKYKYFALDTEHTDEEYFKNGSSDPEHPSPIERNNENYNSYSWKRVLCHDTTLNFYPSGSYDVPEEYQEGMVQCFNKGGATTSEVNYGEYVIIDTISAGEPNNPDNGKVFRRGLNYDNPMGGAEYIGQIIGPKGNISKLDLVDYGDWEGITGTLTVDNDSLVPGHTPAIGGGEENFNDNILYKYISIINEEGTEGNFKVGFQFPYTVLDFTAKLTESDDRTSLSAPDPDQYDTTNGKWNHPYYQKWNLKIPVGIHGTDAFDLEIVKYYTIPNVIYYEDSDCTTVKGTLADGAPVWENYDVTNNVSQIIVVDNESYYVETKDCIRDCLRYKQRIYSNSAMYIDGKAPEYRSEVLFAGFCDTISDVTINSEYKLEITFSDGTSKVIGDPINYIVETALHNGDGDSTKKYHLLIRFAVMDPPQRETVTYDNKEWYDMGNVRGETGGIHIIGNFLSEDDLYDENDNAIPPEDLGGDYNPDWEGWAVTVGDPSIPNAEYILYMYDYNNENWYPVGPLTKTIYVAPIEEEPSIFKDGSDIWLVTDTMSYIQ